MTRRRAPYRCHARPQIRLRHAVPARRADSRTRRPARARCRSTRRRRSCSTDADHAATPVQPADVRQRLFADLAIRRSRRSRSASRRSKAAARRSPRRPAWRRRCWRCSRLRAPATTSSPRARCTAARIRSSPSRSQQFGIDTTFVDADDPESFRARAQAERPRRSTPRRSAIRSSTSPTSRRSPTIAHDAGVPLVIDNTLASPYLCRPFEHGADIVVHSLTKYLGGHGTTMGGILVESGKFPWDNGNFPQMTEPSRGYHGVHLPRDVRRLRVHDEGADGDDAHARARRFRRCRRSCCCRASRRCTCGCRGIANRRSPSRSTSRASRRRVGNYPLLPDNPRARACAALSAARRRRHPDVRRQGRRGGRRTLHRGRAVPVAPRQRRRREDAGHPSGVDDAPPARSKTSSAPPACCRR